MLGASPLSVPSRCRHRHNVGAVVYLSLAAGHNGNFPGHVYTAPRHSTALPGHFPSFVTTTPREGNARQLRHSVCMCRSVPPRPARVTLNRKTGNGLSTENHLSLPLLAAKAADLQNVCCRRTHHTEPSCRRLSRMECVRARTKSNRIVDACNGAGRKRPCCCTPSPVAIIPTLERSRLSIMRAGSDKSYSNAARPSLHAVLDTMPALPCATPHRIRTTPHCFSGQQCCCRMGQRRCRRPISLLSSSAMLWLLRRRRRDLVL